MPADHVLSTSRPRPFATVAYVPGGAAVLEPAVMPGWDPDLSGYRSSQSSPRSFASSMKFSSPGVRYTWRITSPTTSASSWR